MKRLQVIMLLTAFVSCAQSPKQSASAALVAQDSTNNNAVTESKELIQGERINGPANIRGSVNGEAIFLLYDQTLVECTEQQNNWYRVGLFMEIPNNEYNTDTLRKGRKVVVDGKVVGEIRRDVYVNKLTNDRNTWAELIGYTYRDNIYSYSIVEESLKAHLKKFPDRTLRSWQPFIESFQMVKDEYGHFVTYFKYENWIVDPSPLLRVQLVFEKDKLIGVVHSRQINLPNTTGYKLDRGFEVEFYSDTDQQTTADFIKTFNDFIKTVD
jgi:hypothetical protein